MEYNKILSTKYKRINSDVINKNTAFYWHLLSSSILLVILIWLSSGTLCPYAVTLPAPLVDSTHCNYAYNTDHLEHKIPFIMLKGEERTHWEGGLLFRRLLYYWLCFPLMSFFGYLAGGFLTNVIFHLITFVIFIFFIRKEFGEEASKVSCWLLATYPGIHYWASLPYSNSFIVPSCLMVAVLLWKVYKTKDNLKIILFVFLQGVLFSGYDLTSYFLSVNFCILLFRKKWIISFISVIVLLIPQLLISFYITFGLQQPLINSNSGVYNQIIQSYFSVKDFSVWFILIKRFPEILYKNYFYSNFYFFPAISLLLYFSGRFFLNIKLHVVEKSLIISILFLFFFLNLSPLYEGAQMRGVWISRLYQPFFIFYFFYISRLITYLSDKNFIIKKVIYGLIILIIVMNSIIAFGPITNNKLASRVYYNFYQHHNNMQNRPEYIYNMYNNINTLGKRPYGFCK